MKRVGVREFRDHATQYLGGDEVVAVERHGQPIGFYIPTGASRKESFTQALERLEQTVQRMVEETGLSEDELSRLFDPNQPLPERIDEDDNSVASTSRAASR
jgi:NADH:ubiquinone oxidoreductase subunit B-like Fe-S oxidoreductase